MRTLNLLVLSILTLSLQACTMMKVKVSENRRIGVVALVPNKLQTKYVGIWAFSNKGEDCEVPEAHFDSNVTAATVEALRSKGFEAVPVADHPEWWARYDQHRRSLGGFLTSVTVGDTERQSIGAELKAVMAAQHLDAFALVIPAGRQDDSEASLGVGDYGFGTLSGKKEEVAVYTMTDLFIFGGSDLRTRASRIMRTVKPVSGPPFQKSFRDYSAAEQTQLLQAMHDVYKEKIQEAVANLTQP